ncbi:MAG: pseudouridine synthase [Rickettsiales bacterium]|nr:pseudouridine synthase [Rickettsiales bacterium]|tara:strand:- start:6405 stop:7205 length:801 start_codon:yes stop_codon:yes gene_type:complete
MSDNKKNNDKNTMNGDRVAKVMARAGLCSRREAERWIEAGRVSVNGKKLDTPAVTITNNDTLVVDGQEIVTEKPETRVWRFHKKSGYITTHSDEKGRDTIFSQLPPHMPRVISVGRLDMNSEGLLLLTNDGELSRYLELPSTGWKRNYRVRAFGTFDESMKAKIEKGVTIDGVNYGEVDIEFERQQGSNVWLTMGLREGKNREIRKILEHFGLQVNRLIRVSYGPFQLGNLPAGAVEEMRGKVLKEQLVDYFKTKNPSTKKSNKSK